MPLKKIKAACRCRDRRPWPCRVQTARPCRRPNASRSRDQVSSSAPRSTDLTGTSRPVDQLIGGQHSFRRRPAGWRQEPAAATIARSRPRCRPGIPGAVRARRLRLPAEQHGESVGGVECQLTPRPSGLAGLEASVQPLAVHSQVSPSTWSSGTVRRPGWPNGLEANIL